MSQLVNNDVRDLLTFPVRLVGLGIVNPQTIYISCFRQG